MGRRLHRPGRPDGLSQGAGGGWDEAAGRHVNVVAQGPSDDHAVKAANVEASHGEYRHRDLREDVPLAEGLDELDWRGERSELIEALRPALGALR